MNIDKDNEPSLLGNMTALVRSSKKHISAGPLHREATARVHLRQRSKRSYTCLTLEKPFKTVPIQYSDIQCSKLNMKTYHYSQETEEFWSLWPSESSHCHYTVLMDPGAWVLHPLKNKHMLNLPTEKTQHSRQPCHDKLTFNCIHSLKLIYWIILKVCPVMLL